jgi:hypothetical protein
MLQTGAPVRIVRTDDLSAVIHVARVGEGRMMFTVVPLLYGSYQLTEGPGQFSLEPPTELNMDPGLPVVRPSEAQEDIKRFTALREKRREESSESGTASAKPPAAPEVVRVDPSPPGQPVPSKGSLPAIPIATPIAVAARATPRPSPARIASAARPSPTPSVKMAMLVTPSQRRVATPIPVATPIFVATPFPARVETPRMSPSGVRLEPFIKAQRDPSLNAGSSWRTYPPGQAPPGKVVGLDDVAALADRGEIGERLYLRGDFRVTASSPNRAVLRDANKPDDQSPRVLVEYPSGSVAPRERDRLSRDASRPYQIYNVRRGPDGVVTIWVKEITQQ